MIRKLKQEEIPLIVNCYEENMKNNFKDVGEEPIIREKYSDILKENFNKTSMFVLDNNGIKAFLWFVEKENEINIEEIFSTEKGKGYGKHLMVFLLNYSKQKKIKKINADVHFKNKNAVNFFKGLGFTERTIELSLDV